MIPPVEKIWNPLFWFYLAVGLVWAYRSRLALETLKRTPVVAPSESSGASEKERVTVIVPAKNEEKNIETCVRSLLAQDYPHLEIIVVNDNSTDRTEAILNVLGLQIQNSEAVGTQINERNYIKNKILHSSGEYQEAGGPAFRYFNNPTAAPPGWTGKNFAIHQAIPHAAGSWLLFTDADTRHEKSSVRSALGHAQSRDLEFLTLLPECLTGSFLEKMIQPLAMALLGLWFPMQKVNDPKSGVIFANGQFLLMTRALYRKTGGHEAVRGEFLEDFALMRKTRALGARAECAFGYRIFGTRMYDSLSAIRRGWRRIYLHAFQRRPEILFSKTLGVLAFSLLPFALFPFLTAKALAFPKLYGFSWGAAFVILIFILATSWRAYRFVKVNPLYAFLHPAPMFFLMLILGDAAWTAAAKKPTVWR